MSENSKKRTYFNEHIIKLMMARHGVTASYIRMSVNGVRTGSNPIKLAEEYKSMEREANKAIQKTASSL